MATNNDVHIEKTGEKLVKIEKNDFLCLNCFISSDKYIYFPKSNKEADSFHFFAFFLTLATVVSLKIKV